LEHLNDGTETGETWLYLVRIWRGGPGDDTLALRGKLQHVVTGAVGYFGDLSSLPQVLEKMIEEENLAVPPDTDRHNEETTYDTKKKEN
jgi:hypothetical protein